MKKLVMLVAMVALVAAVGVVPALAQTHHWNHNRWNDNRFNDNRFFDPFANGFFRDGLFGNDGFFGNGGGPSISQDIQPQSGDVALNNQVSNSGNYAHQCTPALQNGNSGNFTNSPAILQNGTRSFGGIEPAGIQVQFGGNVSADCPSTIEQSSAASG